MTNRSPEGLIFRRLFRATAIIEGVSWVGLITAMVIKYPLQGTPLGVTIWGWVHGIIWIAFVVATLAAAIRFRWSWWLVPIGLVVSVLPFLTVPFEWWMKRSGRLEVGGRARLSPAAATS